MVYCRPADVFQRPLNLEHAAHLTSTGLAPFLAQTNDYPQKTGTPTNSDYKPPRPIETGSSNGPIHGYFATQSPYFVDDGWGVFEYGLPPQCRIRQVHLLSRHGSRYPVHETSSPLFRRLQTLAINATGRLLFLNSWKYTQGKASMTPLGRLQLFEKGVTMYLRYGGLVNTDKKLLVRTTTSPRMKDSAFNFLAGFFGIDWKKNANVDILYEGKRKPYNNTLAPKGSCALHLNLSKQVNLHHRKYLASYLAAAVDRIQPDILFPVTPVDLFKFQELCSYESNNLGYSKFCDLFTHEEWEGYEYLRDWIWYSTNGRPNKRSKALGIGWVEEFKSRLTNTPINQNHVGAQNTTLNLDPLHFPLDQLLYFDFTHDGAMANILNAMDFSQFDTNFTGNGPRQDTVNYKISRVVPFAAQIIFEVIQCDSPVPADRASVERMGDSTTYIHMTLNDRTVSLSDNFPKFCKQRADGWCEFNSFINHLDTLWSLANYNQVCSL